MDNGERKTGYTIHLYNNVIVKTIADIATIGDPAIFATVHLASRPDSGRVKEGFRRLVCNRKEERLLARMKGTEDLILIARLDYHYQVEGAVDSDGPLLQGGPTIRRSFPRI